MKNFKIYKNKNIILNKGNNRIKRHHLTYLNLKKLLDNKISSKDFKYFELAHHYCNEVNKIIKKQNLINFFLINFLNLKKG